MCGRRVRNCMNSVFDFFTKMVINLDFFFAIPIDIRYKNQRRFTNTTTILFSFLAYILILVPSLYMFYVLFFHTNPTSVSSKIVNRSDYLTLEIKNSTEYSLVRLNPNSTEMTKGLYLFGIGLFDEENSQFISFNASYMILQIYNAVNSKGKKIRDQWDLVKCQQRMEEIELPKEIEDEFNRTMYCINNKTTIAGQFIDSTYAYLSIKVVRCTDKIKSKYAEFKGVTCVNDTEFGNYIKNLMIIYHDVNYFFNPENFSDPIKPYVKKYQFNFVGNLCSKFDMFLSIGFLDSYDNILPNIGFFNVAKSSYYFLNIININRFFSLYNPTDSEIVNIVIRAANIITFNERYYSDIFQILAMLVGLWQAIYAIMNFIVYRYLDFSENVEMCNKIFKLVDPGLMPKITINPFVPDNSIPMGSIKFINSIKNSNVEDIVLYEGFKYDKYAGIKFNSFETLMHMFRYNPPNTKKKLAIIDMATEHYNNYKDAKNLFNFAINMKEFLRFNFSKDQTYIISNFLNKTKFHHKNIENFKIIRNIVSFSSMNDEEDKKLERKEILKNTLNKFRRRNRGELNPIDEKLLKQLRIEENLMDYFVYNEIKGFDISQSSPISNEKGKVLSPANTIKI